jgi:histidyl-tRNA synthetase
LRAADVPFVVNPNLVRGLDYYNGAVYEWLTDRLGAQGTLCAGGRYDGLVEQIGGKPAPACGFAMGVERILALIKDGRQSVPPTAPDVYFVHQGATADRIADTLAERLRDRGVSVLMHCGGGNFKSQMKKADASGARVALIVGDDEANANEVSVKPLRVAAAQSRVPLDQVFELIQRYRDR